MNALELKVPPVVAGLAVAAAMWFASSTVPTPLETPIAFRIVAAAILSALGVGIGLAGVVSFRRVGTTVNPIKPGAASALVTSGPYRVSRNPMYLGMLFVLLGWAFYLSHPLAFILVPLFVLYMNRFQIIPEERSLSAMFGAQFAAYKTKVRRWL